MSQFKENIFRRTELGEAEIHQRSLVLSRAEQVVLLAVDGQSTYAELQMEFADDSSLEFDKIIDALQKKALIHVLTSESQTSPSADVDPVAAQIENFDKEDFFSSSLDPLHSGSGLVVDTRANLMRSVNLKKKDQEKKQDSVYDVDIPLYLELDTNLRLEKEKRKSKLVQVFPDPDRPKKRRRSKRPKVPPPSKWPMRIYMGLTGIGLFLVLVAVLLKM
ncbi:MAG: hypothetical protein ACEQSE_11160 [Candidatus Aquirickettsiella gammari]